MKSYRWPYLARLHAWWLGLRDAFYQARTELEPDLEVHWAEDRLNDAYDRGATVGELLALPWHIARIQRQRWEDFREDYLP